VVLPLEPKNVKRPETALFDDRSHKDLNLRPLGYEDNLTFARVAFSIGGESQNRTYRYQHRAKRLPALDLRFQLEFILDSSAGPDLWDCVFSAPAIWQPVRAHQVRLLLCHPRMF
jgi:hypothetical protein